MLFSFCGRDIADGLQDAPVVEPIDPYEGGEFDTLEGFPGAPVDEFGLVEAVDGLGERVVVKSPTLPTDGSIPASARRSVYLIEIYWLPQSA